MTRLYTTNCTGQVLVDKDVALYRLSDGLNIIPSPLTWSPLTWSPLTCTHKAGQECEYPGSLFMLS